MPKPHQKNCTDTNPCPACQDTQRYVQLVKEGMLATEAQAFIDKARKNREKNIAALKS